MQKGSQSAEDSAAAAECGDVEANSNVRNTRFEPIEDRIRAWGTPRMVTLWGFEVAWSRPSGTFRISLDDSIVPATFSFQSDSTLAYDISQKAYVAPGDDPWHSTMMQLGPETMAAIRQALSEALPRLHPFGLDRERGILIDARTDIADRVVDTGEFERKRTAIEAGGFTVSVHLIPSV